MNINARLNQIDARAQALTADRLIVLYRTPDGEEAEGTVDEMIAASGDFVKVTGGNDLRDLDAILAQMKIEADIFSGRKER